MPFGNIRHVSPQRYDALTILDLACDRDRLPYPNALGGQNLTWLEAPEPEDQAAFAIAKKLDGTITQTAKCRLNPEFFHKARFDVYTGELRRVDLATTDCQCPEVCVQLTQNDLQLLRMGIDAWELCIDTEFPNRVPALPEEKNRDAPKPGQSRCIGGEIKYNEGADESDDEGQLTIKGISKATGSRGSTSQSITPVHPLHKRPPSTIPSNIRAPKRARSAEYTDERRSKKKARVSEGDAYWSYLEYEENGKTIIEILD
ncbi:hypothetical protein VKT23_012346 [Stygiomarasmius scandens]|uniref:Uncharacterized protein n=1 Tax=Marasmiellus scandens TaxID=2682957 RepID=A0ABR1J8G0_9AGAR